MSWTDKELDKLFKSAADAQKVAYQDSYWDEMNALLGAEKKRKGVFWWWFTGFGVILVLSITAGILYSNKIDNKQILTSQTKGKEEVTKDKISPNENLSEVIESDFLNENESINETTFQEELKIKNNQALAKGNNGNKEIVSDISFTMHEFNDASHLNATNLEEDKIKGNSNTTDFVTDSQNDFITSNTLRENLESSPTMKNQLMVDLLDERTNFSILSNYSHEAIHPLSYAFVSRRKLAFYAELNGGLSQSFLITKEGNWGYSANLGAGLEYYHKAWQFGTGLAVRFENYSNIVRHYERNSYGFGLDHEVQDNWYNQFLRAELPISLGYTLNKFEVRAGLTPSYLFATRKEYHLDNSNGIAYNTFESHNESTAEFVQSDYFKPIGLQSNLSVGYAILPKLSLNINTRFQLVNPVKHDHFLGESKSYPITVELGIRKRF